jgi:tetratricopeptide (TPR) repeat protein
MTSNHLLLYRLTELMLEHEQHILPVDLLFDDEQIGDFVKSIQIDSPYQQMVLEGVLTESVRDEKLFVSFTVEGYFHYVLGEVIYNQTNGKGPECLKQIVEVNKLKGAKEGVEQCLIRDVKKRDFSRLIWMIDQNDITLNSSVVPLANAFSNLDHVNEKKTDIYQYYLDHSDSILKKILENPTENDVKALIKSINILRINKKKFLIESIFIGINNLIIPDSMEKAMLCINSIAYLPLELRKKKLLFLLEKSLDFEKNRKSMLLFLFLGEGFFRISEFEFSKECNNIILKTGKKILNNDDQILISCYNNLASISNKFKNNLDAIKYQKKAINLSIRKYGKQHEFTSLYFRNLGTIYSQSGNWKKSIKTLNTSLEIEMILSGEYHENFAHTISNLSISFKYLQNYNKALYYAEKALKIYEILFGKQHSFTGVALNNLGSINYSINNYEKSILYFEKAHEITINNNGLFNHDTATSFNNLGIIKAEIGRFDDALSNFKYSRKIKTKLFGEYHISIAQVIFFIGETYAKKEEYLNAIKSIKNSLKIYKYNHSEINQLKCHSSIGQYYCFIENVKNALKHYKKALKISKETLGENHSSTLLLINKISFLNSNDL